MAGNQVMRIRVAIVDDDAELGENLKTLIDAAPDLVCVGTFPDSDSACKVLLREPPDVVLMDINLGRHSGIDCVARLKAVVPQVQVIMVTVYEDTERIFKALSAGASGYLVKREVGPELLEAIRQVMQGQSPMSGHIARKVVEHFQKPRVSGNTPEELTPAEARVLDQLAQGYMYKEIAANNGITLDTVRTHIRSIYQKLQVHTRAEALLKYLGQT